PPPTTEPLYVPPQAPESPKPKVNRGDIFRKNLDIAKKAEREEAEIPMPTEPPKEEPKPEVTPEPEVKPEEVKPAAETPKSPLDVVTADKKPETKPEEEDDVLKGF